MQETVDLPPDPKRMIEGLRDTGYQFNTAIADVIDNSIAAGAGVVDIRIVMDYEGNIRVSIADDGSGMDKGGLLNAMKYGSPPRPNSKSLGKFGLGLKTASTAFCRRLSVISRPDGEATALRATWDLDLVSAQDKGWPLLLDLATTNEMQTLNGVAPNKAGTVVVWEKVDRLLKTYKDSGGRPAQNALNKSVEGLRDHVAMVYQRFLDTLDGRERNVVVKINAKIVTAWDPFVIGESELVAEEKVPTEIGDGTIAEFTVRAFVLPRGEEFKSDSQRENAKLQNTNQGLYVYRENRLIHGPDWLGMFSKEPHGSLLRVEFSFDNDLDEAFHIDIKKSQIILNEDLYDWLSTFLTAPRRAANDRYRSGQKATAQKLAGSAHDSSNAAIAAREKDLSAAQVQVVNDATGDVQVTNPQGTFRLRIGVSQPQRPGEFFVQPVSSLDDGMLWRATLINTHQAVQINTGHPFYHKVYVPNLASGVIVQGMDSLLYALCAAELTAGTDATSKHFEELRYEVSRILRKLVENLPEPEELNDYGAS